MKLTGQTIEVVDPAWLRLPAGTRLIVDRQDGTRCVVRRSDGCTMAVRGAIRVLHATITINPEDSRAWRLIEA